MAARPLRWMNPAIVAGALVPLASIALRAAGGGLGANPISQALNELGLVALVLLVASLACTPLRLATGWSWPIRTRRTLGLLAFGYAVLHVATYVAIDQRFDLPTLVADLTKRPFIVVGFAALVLLVPLAATSTKAAVRRLGFHRWQRLHRLAYLAAGLGVVHFVWRVKKDVSEPAVYGVLLALLLGARLAAAARSRIRATASS